MPPGALRITNLAAMTSTILLTIVLTVNGSDCLANQREIYLDAVKRLMSINGVDNSYYSMHEKSEPIIFLSEFEEIQGHQNITINDSLIYTVNIININELKEYLNTQNSSGLKVTKFNTSNLIGNKFITSFSSITIVDSSENWVESNDKLGVSVYELSQGCWTYVDE